MSGYKETLNLPQTDFPMKANLSQREPQFLKKWEDSKLYQEMIQKNRDQKRFIFHDGPPYANGHIHYGTILNKILKDTVVKYKNMTGSLCEFVPGWDCHGLPIELQVDKQLGPKKSKMSPLEIRKECVSYASQFIEIQKGEFKRLGCLADWENPYLTMSPHYEATIAKEFGKFVEKGYVYRGKKPVYWCPSCKTALAEAEVEYQDHTSPSIFVKFRIVEKEEKKLQTNWGVQGKLPLFIIIWTTTPWTLPANLALSLHPQYTYCALQVGQEIWIVADGRFEKFLKETGTKDYKVIAKFSSKELENCHALHPFIARQSLVVLGDHVTLEAGTGCVHTAPGHGQEDYIIGQRYNLETFAPVDAGGRFTSEVGLDWLIGKKLEESNQLIIDHMRSNNTLIKDQKMTHSYPHCWRCKKPIIFRATEQWFISMEHNQLRQEVIKAIGQVTWIPTWGNNRILGMIQSRPDWCISRQRLWGVPIIAVICECGEAFTHSDLISNVAKIFEKEGSNAWYSLDLEKVLPARFSCPRCKKKGPFKKEEDILDVWFDSGVSYSAVLEGWGKIKEPADLYLEGSDQHRGWFHTSLLSSVATRGRAPYRNVLTHGFVVDAEGKKLSKSAKNYIPPENVLKIHGAEMLRLWVANEDYRNDIRFSEEILTRLVDSYRKIRNTCRYLLGNLYDFVPGKDDLPMSQLEEMDRWALHVLQDVVGRVRKYYETFEFHMICHALNRFCAVELSSLYFDVLKDRLYTEAKNGPSRRAAQTVLYKIFDSLVKMMAPILSFTAEEAWERGPAYSDKPASVFLTQIPVAQKEWEDKMLSEKWDRFFRMRSEITKALEIARAEKFLGNSLEARLVLEISQDQKSFLTSLGGHLADLLIVSEVVFGKVRGDWVYASSEIAGFKVGVEKALGSKCARCWKYSPKVGANKKFQDVCERCASVLGHG